MSFSVRKGIPTPLELQYEELKKQSAIDRNENQASTPRKRRQSGGIDDEITLSSVHPVADDPARRLQSQPVTADEMQALRTQLSIYA